MPLARARTVIATDTYRVLGILIIFIDDDYVMKYIPLLRCDSILLPFSRIRTGSVWNIF